MLLPYALNKRILMTYFLTRGLNKSISLQNFTINDVFNVRKKPGRILNVSRKRCSSVLIDKNTNLPSLQIHILACSFPLLRTCRCIVVHGILAAHFEEPLPTRRHPFKPLCLPTACVFSIVFGSEPANLLVREVTVVQINPHFLQLFCSLVT